MYGAWIKPDGGTIDVVQNYSHQRHCSYCDAADEGWIGIIHGRGVYSSVGDRYYGMVVRLTPETVTQKALKTLLRMIGKSEEDYFMLENSFASSFEGYTQGMDKRKMQKTIRDLMNGELELKTRL